MTGDNFQKMGYMYDNIFRGYYTPQSDPDIPKFYFPPFGFTDKMLAEGLQFWTDENMHLKRFKFGIQPLEVEYL